MNYRIKRFDAIRILLKHRRMAERRSLDFGKNKAAKVVVFISMALMAVYLMAASVIFALIANDSRTFTATEILCATLPFILTFDFFVRFLAQQTPSQIVKPYTLLPLPTAVGIDAFITSSLINWGNALWLALIIPYIIMSVVFSYGALVSINLILFSYILILANSQWYSIARTLINSNLLWWALPIGYYALAFSPLYIYGDAEIGFDKLVYFYANAGTAIDSHSLLPLLLAMAILAATIAVNRKIQITFVKDELFKTKTVKEIKTVRNYGFLEKYGKLGSFLQLEIKLTLRNKVPKKALLFDSVGVVFISAIIITSDIYDSQGMTNFWGLYNFILYGSTILVKVMGYEGNYIDGLMTRRENILNILKAKYYLMSALLIVPFLLMLPVVISGKWSLFMLVSYAIFTMGFQYFVLLQMAVHNKQTIPLNQKLTNNNGADNNYIQMILMGVIFIVPNVMCAVLQSVFSNNVSYSVMLTIGMVFIATHNLWLKNIYKRLMKRKYINMDGFRTSRQS